MPINKMPIPITNSSAVFQLWDMSKIPPTAPGARAANVYPIDWAMIESERVSAASTLRVTVKTNESGNAKEKAKLEIRIQIIRCQP